MEIFNIINVHTELNGSWTNFAINIIDNMLSNIPIEGCTDVSACNYNSDATDDDGSCLQNDCTGVCGGSALEDECGVCDGDSSTCKDCNGVVNGDNVEDNCGTCDNDGSNDCVQDCTGTWGGNATQEECNACSEEFDCEGVCGGSAVEDECGVCNGGGIAEGTCDCEGSVLDCAGECGGVAVEDCLGVCGGAAIVNSDGDCLLSIYRDGIIPDQFAISQNYPNPFNPSTRIRFDVAKFSNISIIVYDLSGKEVIKLIDGTYTPGIYEVLLDLSQIDDGISSGMYIYRLITEDIVISRKMLYLK